MPIFIGFLNNMLKCMTLIKSISGIRGTIGGKAGDGLSPLDTVKFVSAYGQWIIDRFKSDNVKVIVGRDARISGEMVSQIVIGTLMGMGIDVVNIGLATTPTTEIAVTNEKAQGGIILTASHNPKQWNALKLLNEKGEFLSTVDGVKILELNCENNLQQTEISQQRKMRNIYFIAFVFAVAAILLYQLHYKVSHKFIII